MSEPLSDEYRLFVEHLTDFFQFSEGLTLERQIRWATTEVGEVNEAHLLMEGAIPRKRDQVRTLDDVADEFADVVISALIGILLTGRDLQETLARQRAKTERRLEEYGAVIG